MKTETIIRCTIVAVWLYLIGAFILGRIHWSPKESKAPDEPVRAVQEASMIPACAERLFSRPIGGRWSE